VTGDLGDVLRYPEVHKELWEAVVVVVGCCGRQRGGGDADQDEEVADN
jgi:hypothetical protein